MFFECRNHVLQAFREIGVKDSQLHPRQRPPEQYQQAGVWVFTVESTFERHNKAAKELSQAVKRILFRGNTIVRVEIVAQKEETLLEWLELALKWLLEYKLEVGGYLCESFITPTRFQFQDEDGVLPDVRFVRFEIAFGDAIQNTITRTTITPELEDITLEV
jgi:hypothetical protein